MATIVFQHGPLSPVGRLGVVLRDHGHMLDIRRVDLPPEQGGKPIPPDFDNVDSVISLGGPQDVMCTEPWVEAEIEYLREAHERSLPLVGICLGHQFIAKALGAEVGRAEQPEWGFCRVDQTPAGNVDRVLAGVPWSTWQFQSHEWEVKSPPPGATLLQTSERCKVQAFVVGLRTYCFQYHPEYDLETARKVARVNREKFEAQGIDEPAVGAQLDEKYDTFERLSNRMFTNMATFLFPVTRRITA